MKSRVTTKGFSVLEIVVAASIILVITVAFAGAWRTYIILTRITHEKMEAAALTEETAEILQFLRDTSWSTNIATLSLNTPYYLSWNGSTYIPTDTPSLIQNTFIRTITLSPVYRNGSDDIVSNGGTLDTKTKKVTVAIATNQSPPEVSVTTESLLHDIYNN
jgi:Tfp pilus assembly protein PilE